MFKGIYKYLLVGFGAVFFSAQCHAARIMNKNPIKEDWKCKIVDGEWKCDRSEKPKNVFDKKLKKPQIEKALAGDLGWVNKPDYFVGGYYNNDSQFTKALCESKKTNLSYENAEYDTDGTLIASGNVEVLQCDQEMYSNNAIVSFKPDKSGIQSLVMTGDVISKQPSTGTTIRTTELDVNMDDGTYSAGKTFFRMAREVPETRIYDKEHFSGYLRGYADTFKKQGDDLILKNGYITSGDPYDNDWKLTGKTIDIDTKEEMAYIRDGFLKIKDIPVMYIPYFSHPTNNKRKSGLLTPDIVNTEKTGYGISVPYYFNLAPNYDLMLETVLWQKRGLMENGTFRYITDYFQGQFEGSIVPYDFETNKMRGAFTYSNTGDFNNGITTNFKYDYVSDAEYYNDFSVGNINLVTKTLLDREFDINYSNDNITSSLTVLGYGVVNPEMNLANIPYAKLPEFKFDATGDGYTPDALSLSIETLNTFFYKAPSIADTSVAKPVEGTNVNTFRGYESPKIQGNFSESWGFLKPSLEAPIRYYQLNNRDTDTIKFKKDSVASVLPIFNIDAGAYFDRDYTTKDGAYTQSLEPRLFYTYIPYQDQTDIPLFDTSIQNQQYMQMFEVNRFTGYDRINNANQVTYALESSTINQEDGSTLSSMKIGQMMYLADRKVTLCQGNSTCKTPGEMDIFSKESFSPIMSSFEYQIMHNIYLSAQVNYKVQQKNIDYQVYQLSYKDENENIFNISYNNIADNWNALTQDQINNGTKPISQETVALSSIINLTDHWGLAGLWNYNFQQKQISDWFVGFQYDHKSWAVRALMQASAFTNQNPNDPQKLGSLVNSYVLQFELKGIGGMGNSSNLSSRLSQINGYEPGQWGDGV
jgi:LPS-assembly protein